MPERILEELDLREAIGNQKGDEYLDGRVVYINKRIPHVAEREARLANAAGTKDGCGRSVPSGGRANINKTIENLTPGAALTRTDFICPHFAIWIRRQQETRGAIETRTVVFPEGLARGNEYFFVVTDKVDVVHDGTVLGERFLGRQGQLVPRLLQKLFQGGRNRNELSGLDVSFASGGGRRCPDGPFRRPWAHRGDWGTPRTAEPWAQAPSARSCGGSLVLRPGALRRVLSRPSAVRSWLGQLRSGYFGMRTSPPK